MEQLVLFLEKRSTSIMAKVSSGIVTGIVINALLIAGVIFILSSFSADPVSLITGASGLSVLIIFEIMSLRSIHLLSELDTYDGNLRDNLLMRLEFFKNSYAWVIWSLGLSGAFFYIIGGLIYHNLKYGGVYLDGSDVVVNLIFISLALVIGFVSHTFHHTQYRKELKNCLDDLSRGDLSEDHDKYALKIQGARKVSMILVLAGLIILMLILFFYNLFGSPLVH